MKKFSEPAMAAAQFRRFRTSIEAFGQRLANVDRLLNVEAVSIYREQFDKAKAAREASNIAVKGKFENDPLRNSIGSAAWRKLYECAENSI